MATVNTNGTKLTDAQRNAIEEAADAAGLDVRSDYSGRGMYGEQCFGVIGTLRGFVKFIIILVGLDAELLSRMEKRLRTDDMAGDTIYYFPGFEF